MDLKCFGQEYCWYCINRCSFCLQLAGSNYSELEDIGRTLRFCSQECSEQLKTVIPLRTTLRQVPIAQEEIKDIMAIDICGTGKTTNSELGYVSFNLYMGRDNSSCNSINAFAFYNSRSICLQTILQLSVRESGSHITFSSPSLPQAMQGAISELTDLLMHTLSFLTIKEDLPLTLLYKSFRDQNKLNKVCQLDTVAVKVLYPTLKVTLIHDMLKNESTDSQCISPSSCNSKDVKMHQEMLHTDGDTVNLERETQLLSFHTLEITEDGLSKLLRVLPAECAVCTDFLMSVHLLSFKEKLYKKRYNLPIKTAEKICLMHFYRANDTLKLPLKESNEMNESCYKDICDNFSKAKTCMKYIPAFGLRKIGDLIAESMQAITNTFCQLCDLLYCGE